MINNTEPTLTQNPEEKKTFMQLFHVLEGNKFDTLGFKPCFFLQTDSHLQIHHQI